ncbi:MAG: metal ABC transporter substrate-binding protein [Planctomycetota bacterium]|jgi:zinc transport system substrate-binding protein
MRKWTSLALAALLLAACGEDSAPRVPRTTHSQTPVVVHAVNYPLAWFAERIGGDLVDVRFPAPADEDPAFWAPTDEEIAAYQGADVILLNGAGYAAWVPQVTLPPSRCVVTSKAFQDRYLMQASRTTHTHGPAGEHEHGGLAFTTWLDPQLAVEQARAVYEALASRIPARREALETRFGDLERDLGMLDAELQRILADASTRPLVGSHPVYQYFARRYALDFESVHFEPDEIPDAEAWKQLEELLVDHPAALMLWEGEPLEATRTRLETLGIESVVFDPCGNRPESGDYLTVMRANAQALERALER